MSHQDHSHEHPHEHGHSHDNHSHNHGPHHSRNHSHGHGHHHGHHHFSSSEGNRKGLTIALIITVSIMLLEFFGGIITNSLALLSDSGHMLSDGASLLLSLIAVWLAAKPATSGKTFGYHRFEILAALFNGVTLFAVAIFIMREAYGRFIEPPVVASGSMMVIAAVGLLANMLSAYSLMRKGDVKNNMNLRSAYLHIIGDALGSVGAIIAGFLMFAFSWHIADPVISVIVSLLILKSAWSLIKHALHILMEGTPASVSSSDVRNALEEIEGVVDVHDLHIWTITSGLDSLSCHLLIEDGSDGQTILQQAIHKLEEQFQIHHTTIQIETSAIKHSPLKV